MLRKLLCMCLNNEVKMATHVQLGIHLLLSQNGAFLVRQALLRFSNKVNRILLPLAKLLELEFQRNLLEFDTKALLNFSFPSKLHFETPP